MTVFIPFLLTLAAGQAGGDITPPSQATPREILADMRWLEGAWRGEFAGSPFEAIYSSPEGDAILSLSKEFHGNEPGFIEFEKFQIEDGKVVLTPYPDGEKSDSFPLLRYDASAKSAVFENLAHDFPTRIAYRLLSPETLVISVSGEVKGELREFIATLAKVSPMKEEKRYTEAESHKKYAIDIFNAIWPLLEKPNRTEDENEKMIQMAYASTFHWREAGTAINQTRGEWMISRVNTVLGRGEAAWHHATRSHAICRENGFGDFDLAYAYEAMARAAALKGDKKGFEENYLLAEQAGEKILEKEDKDLFNNDLSSEPWFGMK